MAAKPSPLILVALCACVTATAAASTSGALQREPATKEGRLAPQAIFQAEERHHQRVAGGKPAAPFKYPFVVEVHYFSGQSEVHQGSGVIIDPFNVLTIATYCQRLETAGGLSRPEIRAGAYDQNNPLERIEQIIPIVDVVKHPDYISEVGATSPNDLCMLKLGSPLIFNRFVQPAVLPLPGSTFTGVPVAVGWGLGQDNPSDGRLQKLNMEILPDQQCEERYSYMSYDGRRMMCAGGIPGEGLCDGDGGSPLICQDGGVNKVCGLFAYYVYDNTNTNPTCGDGTNPDVFTELAFFYNWILANSQSNV